MSFTNQEPLVPDGGQTPGTMPGTTPVAPRATRSFRSAALAAGVRLLNPLTRHLAGSRYLPVVVLVRHRGRRSGRMYATPTAGRPTADGFIVPLTFGQGSDWFRNVRAAGGCVIRWRGTDYPLVEPEVVDWATARSAFLPVERALFPLFGIEQFVRLRRAPTH